LVALYPTGERRGGHVVWHCRCDCGDEVDARGNNLTSGRTTSCGCYNRERVAEAHTVHGMARYGKQHPVYDAWTHMIQRCENPNDPAYKNYGARGITVCEEWHDAKAFIEWALAHGWQEGLSIDRIDNDKGYSPDNCRWATWKEQQRNKRNNHLITFNRKTQTLAEWAEEVGVKRHVLNNRINVLHWPIERALSI